MCVWLNLDKLWCTISPFISTFSHVPLRVEMLVDQQYIAKKSGTDTTWPEDKSLWPRPSNLHFRWQVIIICAGKYLNKQQNRLAQNVQTFSVPRQYILVTMMVDDDGDNKLMVSLDWFFLFEHGITFVTGMHAPSEWIAIRGWAPDFSFGSTVTSKF